jgi:NAD(P)H dehydrogenase (quinone)
MGERTLLVTGAAGQLGTEVVSILRAQGGDRLVLGTRDPAKLAHLAAQGVEVRKVDFDDEASLAAGFTGVDRALVISSDALDRPGRRAEQHIRAFQAAQAAGVGHVVYTSATGASPQATFGIARDHGLSEAFLEGTTLGYTSLRDNLYAELLLGNAGHAIASGELFTARGAGKVGYVSRQDCARAAAAALADTFSGRRTLEVGGLTAIDGDTIASILTGISGRPIAHIPVTAEGFAAGLVAAGFPQFVADLFASFETAIGQGAFDATGNAWDALGIAPPTSVRDFLARALAAV